MPEPPQPATPTYRGRPLVRPVDDVTDQGLAFDLGTILGRRRVLRLLGLGAASVGWAACGGTTEPDAGSTSSSRVGTAAGPDSNSGEIPDETAGPYPADGSNGPDVLGESGVVRSDIRSSFGAASGTAPGVPMTLELTIRNLADGGNPYTGTAVYVWHCDREGRYSLYSTGITEENYLRGVQVADADGKVRFTSIFPACYSGRWPHIHFEVYPDASTITDAANALATSQVALPEDICDVVYAEAGYEQSIRNLARVTLDDDNVFGDDSGATQLATVSGDVSTGYAVSLDVRVDPTTTPTGGQLTGDGAPAGAPPGPGRRPPPR